MDMIQVVLVGMVCAEQHLDAGRSFDLVGDLSHAGKWPAVAMGDLALIRQCRFARLWFA